MHSQRYPLLPCPLRDAPLRSPPGLARRLVSRVLIIPLCPRPARQLLCCHGSIRVVGSPCAHGARRFIPHRVSAAGFKTLQAELLGESAVSNNRFLPVKRGADEYRLSPETQGRIRKRQGG